MCISGGRRAGWYAAPPKQIEEQAPKEHKGDDRGDKGGAGERTGPPGALAVRRSIRNIDRAKAMAPVISASSRAAFLNDDDCCFWWRVSIFLYLFHLGFAEQAGWQEDQDNDQNGKGGYIFVADREIGRPERLHQADDQASEHGARERSAAPSFTQLLSSLLWVPSHMGSFLVCLHPHK